MESKMVGNRLSRFLAVAVMSGVAGALLASNLSDALAQSDGNESQNILETSAIRFVDEDGETQGMLTVRQATIMGERTAQLVLRDADGRVAWSAPRNVRTIPVR